MRTARDAVVLAVLLVGCTDTTNELSVVASGEAAEFGVFVQPILRSQCASLDCHGDPFRPLRLYALNGLRLDADLRGDPESGEELAANSLSLASLDPSAAPQDSLVVNKPLAESAGGYYHVGGDLFENRSSPGYECILAWLSGDLVGSAPNELRCEEAVQ